MIDVMARLGKYKKAQKIDCSDALSGDRVLIRCQIDKEKSLRA
jgi:hypothetical protein